MSRLRTCGRLAWLSLAVPLLLAQPASAAPGWPAPCAPSAPAEPAAPRGQAAGTSVPAALGGQPAASPGGQLPASPTAGRVAQVELEVLRLLHRAIASNPALTAALAELRSATWELAAARSLPNPSISFVPGVTSPNGTGEELMVTQSLGFNGALAARARLARARLLGTRARALAQLHDLVLAVRTASSELQRARTQVELAQESFEAAEKVVRLARQQADGGSRPEVEVAQTRLDALRARQQLLGAEADACTASAALRALLGRVDAPEAEVLQEPSLGAVPAQPTTGDGANRPGEGSLGEVQRALTSRPEALLAAAACQEALAEAALVRTEGRIDVVPQFRANNVVQGVRDYGIGVAVSLPIIDLGSVRHRVRAADERAQAAVARQRAAEQELRREVAQAQARVVAAAATLEVAAEACAQSQRLLEACRTGFAAGITSVLTLLEVQRSWRATRTERADAASRLAIAQAQLDRALGLLPAPWADLAGGGGAMQIETLRTRGTP